MDLVLSPAGCPHILLQCFGLVEVRDPAENITGANSDENNRNDMANSF